MLRALAPTGTRRDIAWNAWESLGPERIQLAELLFARGLLAEAFGVATQLDATEPTTYPLYQRASLTLRLRIAEAMRNSKLATDYRRRLVALNWTG
jgi:Tfp pilus assembly protein PilF